MEHIWPKKSGPIGRQQTSSEVDFIKNGVLYKEATASAVLVTAQSDLASLTGYAPGTIAYTAGFKNIWELSAAGTWVDVLN